MSFRHLAMAYSTNHKDMSSATRKGCGYDGYNFGRQGGITNGAAWYSVQGGRLSSKNLKARGVLKRAILFFWGGVARTVFSGS